MEEEIVSPLPIVLETLHGDISADTEEINASIAVDITNATDNKSVSVDDAEPAPVCEDYEGDNSIHGFNLSNVTVIERINVNTQSNDDNNSNSNLTTNSKVCDLDSSVNTKVSDLDLSLTSKGCEGSDSGVEVLDNVSGECRLKRTLSSNSGNYHDFDNVTPARSCDSSIISCCSNYEEAYNILARRNSTLMEDYNLRSGDGTSENGSESSSLSRSSSKASRNKTGITNSKRKNMTPDNRSQQIRNRTGMTNGHLQKPSDKLANKGTPLRSSSSSTSNRSKALPPKLSLSASKKDSNNKSLLRNVATCKTPSTSPADDGRWPSINSKPAPLMGRSTKMSVETPKCRVLTDSIYATFPRRRKDKESKESTNRSGSREGSINKTIFKKQSTTPLRSLPPYPKRKSAPKTKIYHETSIQTALTNEDIEKALAGVMIKPCAPQDVEFNDVSVQVDIANVKAKKTQEQLQDVSAKYEKLMKEFDEQQERLRDTERRLKEEKTEKQGLQEELKHNTERVLAILGNDVNPSTGVAEENVTSDSLVVLESRYRKVGDIVIKQEEEISELNTFCRTLQRELDKSMMVQHTLVQNLQELESETKELQEFMQAEKNALSDALKESEAEIKKLNATLVNKQKEIESKTEECRQLTRLSEQRRLENMDLQSRISALESNYKDILVQGSKISSAAIALSLLISRLDSLNQELIKSYNISEQELEDVIFHNEAYTNSSNSPDLTPEKQKTFDQDNMTGSITSSRASSFVSAIIHAIKNAASQSLLYYRELGSESMHAEVQNTSEILDLETEPCLMMEPVLEDVVLPDTHSQNLVSSSSLANSIRLTRSESLTNLSNSFTQRQFSLDNTESMNTSLISNSSSYSDFGSSTSLLDQIIHLDNLVTKLLKILRIIQIENEEMQTDLQEERDNLVVQVEKQKEGNKIVAKQLKDWETLGSRLKKEVKELKQELGKKNTEIQNVKLEGDKSKKDIEKLNEDICTLSTLCSKCEHNNLTAETTPKSNDKTPVQFEELDLSKEVILLKEKLQGREKQLQEIMDECRASKQVQTENFKIAIEEAKKQYKAIDNALEILHSIQPVVQECPQLAKLQSDLEDLNFQTISSIPLAVPSEFNSSAPVLVRTVTDLEIPSPINSTA